MLRTTVLALFASTWACATGPVSSHRTPLILPEATLRFAICGDMRSDQGPIKDGQRTEQGRLFAELVRRRPDFVINTGDLVTRGDVPQDWAIFDQLTQGLASAGIPYYPLLGNHEYLGRAALGLPYYFERFPDLNGAKWYGLKAGPLYLLFLDSNLSELSAEDRATQGRYADQSVLRAQQDPSVRFVAVAFHHPPRTNGPHPPALEAEAELLKPLRVYSKLKLVISGHVHSYERFLEDGLSYVVSGGCGAPPYPVEIDPQRVRFRPAFDGPAERNYHFLECQVDAQALRCQTESLSGEAFVTTDRFVIQNPVRPGIEAYDD